MSDVIGLVLRENQIDCAVVRRRLGRARVLGTFSLSAEENPGSALRAKLRELGIRTRRVHVGIPRRRAVVKVIELPAVAGADLRRMVGFELERHLPFPASEAVFDFDVLDPSPGRPVRVLLEAAERRVYERVEQLLRDAGLVPRLVGVTVHSLAALAAPSTKGRMREGHVVVHVEGAEAELVVMRGGRPILSRAFALPADPKERSLAIATELRRSLGSLHPDDGQAVGDVILTGDSLLPDPNWVGLPTQLAMPLPSGLSGITEGSPFLPAVALALRAPRRGLVRTNLIPEEIRPRPFPWPVAVTAALAALTLLLAAAIPSVTTIRDERALSKLSRQVDALAPRMKEVEQLVAQVERARREVDTLRGFATQHVRALPLLRELTELLPTDVWLTNLSIDRKGLELAGFAAAAAQLIPLLEASPALERVEFTSPVTKGRDREQFRLKATWERGAAPAEAPTEDSPARVGAPAPVKTR
ncbi:MAG: PilN domain-containing protein [Candidatus Rokuibacteriota bacterium]